MKTGLLFAALLLSACSENDSRRPPPQGNELFNVVARSTDGDVDFNLTGASLNKAYATMCARVRCDRRENYRAEVNILDGHVGYVFYHKDLSLTPLNSPFALTFMCDYPNEPVIYSSGRPPPPPSPPPPEPMPQCGAGGHF